MISPYTTGICLHKPHKLFDEAVVDVSNGQLVRLPELSSRLTVGEKGSVSGSLCLSSSM